MRLLVVVNVICLLVMQWECHTEYKNAPELCAVAFSDNQNRLQNDLVLLANGSITQDQFEQRKRTRENGTLGLCLISLIKTKENSNF